MIARRPLGGAAMSALLGIALTVPSPARTDDDGDHRDRNRTISVSGSGSVSVKPNLVRTNIGVNITSPTFGEAMRRHRETMSGILALFRSLGVADEDVMTDNFSFGYRPPYERDDRWVDGEYQVNNMVRVFIRDMETVDQILERVVEFGANRIHGLEFLVEDRRAAESAAREKAAADARAKAEELARLHGMKLGKVVSVSEVSSGGPGPLRMERALMASADASITSPGERTVLARLSVVYSIR